MGLLQPLGKLANSQLSVVTNTKLSQHGRTLALRVLLAASMVSWPPGGTVCNQATWDSVSQGHEKNLEKTISFTLN